jgi:hypothetical protein
MRKVELEIDKLVGYFAGPQRDQRIIKRGSAKLGEKEHAPVAQVSQQPQTQGLGRVKAPV